MFLKVGRIIFVFEVAYKTNDTIIAIEENKVGKQTLKPFNISYRRSISSIFSEMCFILTAGL